MISVEHARVMARYNRWQNQSLYGAAETISDAERRKDRGAFWGSIHGTLSHLLWGDRMWHSRFVGAEKREGVGKDSPNLFPDWEDMKAKRVDFDQALIAWAEALDPSWLDGDLVWFSGIAKAERRMPKWLLLTHFYNHQTHHRGQVHAMLTQAGAKPDDTDLMLMKM